MEKTKTVLLVILGLGIFFVFGTASAYIIAILSAMSAAFHACMLMPAGSGFLQDLIVNVLPVVLSMALIHRFAGSRKAVYLLGIAFVVISIIGGAVTLVQADYWTMTALAAAAACAILLIRKW